MEEQSEYWGGRGVMGREGREGTGICIQTVIARYFIFNSKCTKKPFGGRAPSESPLGDLKFPQDPLSAVGPGK